MAARARPLASMTGFGRGRAEGRAAVAECELRSVNGKGLHVRLGLPPDRLALEARAEELLRRRLRRGSVQGWVRLRLRAAATVFDEEVLAQQLRAWQRTARRLGLAPETPSLEDLLELPGALRAGDEDERGRAAVERIALAAVRSALDALVASREREGARLRRELQRLLARARRHLARIERRVPQARRAAQERLRERLRDAFAAEGLTLEDQPEVVRELLVLAERLDVQEELSRLDMHLARFEELLGRGGPVGAELDFVLQEAHREANTLGNKSADAALSREVVALKLVLKQLKEQAANVE